MTDECDETTIRLNDLEAKVDQVVMNRLTQTEERIDELEATVDELVAENQQLQGELESLTGLADDQASTPEKRAADLRQKLINVAKARDNGFVSWSYSDVKDQLESDGHGTVYPAQAYQAMKDAADSDEDANTSHAAGFGYVKNNDDDWTIRVSLDALPAYVGVNEINNAEGESPGAQTANTAESTTMD